MVFIESVEITWFRGIKEASINDLTDVNVFLGSNGVGKSSILEAIYLVSTWFNDKDLIRGIGKTDYIVYRRTGRGDWGRLKDLLWYNMDTSKDIEIKLTSRKEKLEYIVPYSYESKPPVLLKPLKEILVKYKVFSNTYLIPQGKGFYEYKSKYTKTFDPKISIWISSIIDKYNGFLRNTLFIDPLFLRKPVYLERFIWSKLLSRRLDKRVVGFIREYYEGDAEGLTYAPFGDTYMLFLNLSDTTVAIDSLGDGVRSAIALLSALLIVRDTVVLIEDPEIHQHPRGLGFISKALAEMSRENNLQFIISTQSLEFVRVLSRVCSEEGIGFRVFFIEKSNGVVEARVLESVDIDTLRSLGIDPRFLDVL